MINGSVFYPQKVQAQFNAYAYTALRQFAHGRTIDEYDVTIVVSYIRVTSQINDGDVTILNQKRLSLATTAKSAIDNCFGGIECSGHQNTFVTLSNDFWVTRDAICQ